MPKLLINIPKFMINDFTIDFYRSLILFTFGFARNGWDRNIFHPQLFFLNIVFNNLTNVLVELLVNQTIITCHSHPKTGNPTLCANCKADVA